MLFRKHKDANVLNYDCKHGWINSSLWAFIELCAAIQEISEQLIFIFLLPWLLLLWKSLIPLISQTNTTFNLFLFLQQTSRNTSCFLKTNQKYRVHIYHLTPSLSRPLYRLSLFSFSRLSYEFRPNSLRLPAENPASRLPAQVEEHGSIVTGAGDLPRKQKGSFVSPLDKRGWVRHHLKHSLSRLHSQKTLIKLSGFVLHPINIPWGCTSDTLVREDIGRVCVSVSNVKKGDSSPENPLSSELCVSMLPVKREITIWGKGLSGLCMHCVGYTLDLQLQSLEEMCDIGLRRRRRRRRKRRRRRCQTVTVICTSSTSVFSNRVIEETLSVYLRIVGSRDCSTHYSRWAYTHTHTHTDLDRHT